MSEPSQSGRIEQRVNQGLLGQWYVVAKSVEIPRNKPHAVKALGRNLVLWRGADGKVHCLDDRCPHRGAPLSQGEMLEGNIACRYHGVMLDGTGKVVRVPAMPNCALEGRQGAEAYATHEANDGVFVYFPSADHPEPRPIDLPRHGSAIIVTRSTTSSIRCTGLTCMRAALRLGMDPSRIW
jgi:phenylpropionate dioxygenase-like ring-hydroxylating dioxygenase large terminal subunit